MPSTLPTDRRYRTARWRRVRALVLARDLHRCYVVACPDPGNVADHIDPVYQGMPDALFFDPANLRASCRRHNTARGVAARLERELATGVRPATPRGGIARPSRFSRGHGSNDWPLSVSYTREPTVTRDYSRKPTGAA